MEKRIFKVGEEVTCVYVLPLTGKEIAPSLELNKKYEIKTICLDSKGNQHLDVGLKSSINFVTSFETGEQLPNGDVIHWCHPTRFI